jgi:hypothetical protein
MCFDAVLYKNALIVNTVMVSLGVYDFIELAYKEQLLLAAVLVGIAVVTGQIVHCK